MKADVLTLEEEEQLWIKDVLGGNNAISLNWEPDVVIVVGKLLPSCKWEGHFPWQYLHVGLFILASPHKWRELNVTGEHVLYKQV